jgi:hypothetical protein
MLGLMVDDLTVPDILEPYSVDRLIEVIVSRVLTPPVPGSEAARDADAAQGADGAAGAGKPR